MKDLIFGALEAGGTKMVCAVGDANGNILHRTSIPTEAPADTMRQMVEFFRSHNICALGIGCFGPVDLNKKSVTYGHITTTPKLAWQYYDIVGAFREALGVPIGLDTDVNAAALGEATFGCTQDVENSIYITVGTGIGVGIIANGQPYHGRMHPEGGHILLRTHPNDPMSAGACPFHEHCLEGLAAGPSLEKRWGIKGQLLAERPEVWELEAYYIGQAITNYIMLLSPERIVLGGGVMKQDHLLPMIRAEVEKQVNGYVALPDLEQYIVAPSLNDNQGVMGAVALAVQAYQEETK